MVGVAGCGKSTWLARRGIEPLSSDEMRRLLADSAVDQTIHRHVFAALRYLAAQRLAIGRTVTYIDATHLTRKERTPWRALAKRKGCDLEAVFFDVPVEVCLERNRGRERQVPEDVIWRMQKKLEPPTREEGFVRLVRVKG